MVKIEKKIIIEVTEELHSRIKVNCALKKISIKQWVSEAILNKMMEDDSKNMPKMQK